MIAEGRGPDIKFDTTIVGVVGNVKHQDLRTDIGPAVYRAYLQLDHPTGVQFYARIVGVAGSYRAGHPQRRASARPHAGG